MYVYTYVISALCIYHTAIANLNGVTLYGKKVHVTLSKHSTVQMPQAGSNVRLNLHVTSYILYVTCALYIYMYVLWGDVAFSLYRIVKQSTKTN